jgi:hypothetical protein
MESVIESLQSIPLFEERVKRIFLYTREFVLDFLTTGRTSINQLSKAEKTILGIKFEDMFKREFELVPGDKLDCVVGGTEVDIKFTCRNNWMIPPKCFDEICLLAKMDDEKFSLGLIHATQDTLTKSANWDRKKQICLTGKGNIHWLFLSQEL